MMAYGTPGDDVECTGVSLASASGESVITHCASQKRLAELSAKQDKRLSDLGITASARRHFNRFTTFGLSSSICSVIVGIIPLYGQSLSAGGTGTMIWLWLVLGFMSLIHVSCLAEMSSCYPTMGTMYFWSSKIGGRAWGPFSSWLCGWLNLVGQVASIGAAGFSAAQQLGTLVSLLGGDIPSNAETFGIFCGLMALCAVTNTFTETALTSASYLSILVHIVGSIFIVVLLLCASGSGGSSVLSGPSHTSLQSPSFVFTGFNNDIGYSSLFYVAVVGSLSAASTYTGYDTAASISEEALDSSNETPSAMIMSVASAAVLGAFLIIGLNFSIQDIDAITSADSGVAFSVLVQQNMAPAWSAVFSSILFVAMQCAATANLTSSARLIFSFSRNGALPFSSFWASMDERFNCPVRAVWLGAALSVIMAAVGFGSNLLEAFFSLATVAYYSCYFVPVFCRVTVGREMELYHGSFHLGAWSRPMCAVSSCFCLFMTIALSLPMRQGAINYSGPALAATLVLASLSWQMSARSWYLQPSKPKPKMPQLDSMATLETDFTGATLDDLEGSVFGDASPRSLGGAPSSESLSATAAAFGMHQPQALDLPVAATTADAPEQFLPLPLPLPLPLARVQTLAPASLSSMGELCGDAPTKHQQPKQTPRRVLVPAQAPLLPAPASLAELC